MLLPLKKQNYFFTVWMFWLHIHICVCLMFIELRRSTRRVQGPLGRDLQVLVAICMGAGYWTWVLWMSRPCFNHWAISPTWHVILERLKCEATSGIFIYCLFLKDHWTLKCLMILAKRTLWSYALACLPACLPSLLSFSDSFVCTGIHLCEYGHMPAEVREQSGGQSYSSTS